MINRWLQRLSLETETWAKFSGVKPRLDKLNQKIKQRSEMKWNQEYLIDTDNREIDQY